MVSLATVTCRKAASKYAVTAMTKFFCQLSFQSSFVVSFFVKNVMAGNSVAKCRIPSSQSTPSVERWLHVEGYNSASNIVLYHPAVAGPRKSSIVIFFPGDVQDFAENMWKYNAWNLDAVTLLLHRRFPNSEVLVVRPVGFYQQTYACYKNFLNCDKFGAPKHSHTSFAFEHVKALLENVFRLRQAQPKPTSAESACQATDLDDASIILIGFSKGCVVLNQFLHEMSAAKKSGIWSRFVSQIKSMYWLDGGHPGAKQTWITEENVLMPLAESDIEVHVHVTPYQINDSSRPWIGKEERLFTSRLLQMGKTVHRTVHFNDERRSIENHFKILEKF